MSGFREGLIQAFRNRQYRESYATEHLNSTIAAQMVAIREQRGLTQTGMADLLGTKQSGIARIEDENHGRWNIKTLREYFFQLGCRLRVTAEPFGTLIDEVDSISRKNLERVSFEDDPVFAPVSERVAWMQELVLPWLEKQDAGPEPLLEWLSGRSLPPFGDEEPPYLWILRAIPGGRESLHYRELTVRVESILDRPRTDPQASVDFAANLYSLAAELAAPVLLFPKLYAALEAIQAGTFTPPPEQRGALRLALKFNQSPRMTPAQSEVLKLLWVEMIDGVEGRPLLGNFIDGWQGVKLLPGPNVEALALALQRFDLRQWRSQAGLSPYQLLEELQSLGFLSEVGRWAVACKNHCWLDPMTHYWWRLVAPDIEAELRLIENETDPSRKNLMTGIATDCWAAKASEAEQANRQLRGERSLAR